MYNEIERLKALNRKAKTQKECDAIDAQLKTLSMKNPEQFAAGFEESLHHSINEYKANTIKEQLREVSEFISLSYIAKKYFNKSRTWIYQRINNYDVNGKPVFFTRQEIDTLNLALEDISHKTGSVKVSL
jgi:hypothetical protein